MAYFENIDEPQIADVKRPVFLTVICILTFVGCGIYLISGLFGMFNSQEEELRRSFEMQKDVPMTRDMAKAMLAKLPEFMKWSAISNYATLLNVALCLTGSLLMWNLRKVGFVLYIGGQIVSIVVGVLVYLVIKDVPIMGMTTMISLVLTTLIYLAFVIMYGVNLKHMR